MPVRDGTRLGGGFLNGIARCPHCGIANPQMPQTWVGQHLPRGDAGPISLWAAYRCTSCGSVVTAKGQPGAPEANPLIVSLFPDVREASADLPLRARTYLQQAYNSLAAPDGAAMLAGSAVDAMLKELGYDKGSVYERIDQAVKDNAITANMAEWAHSVRLGANRPRHADKDDPHVSLDEAMQSVEFADALGQFLFVLKARIERGIAATKP